MMKTADSGNLLYLAKKETEAQMAVVGGVHKVCREAILYICECPSLLFWHALQYLFPIYELTELCVAPSQFECLFCITRGIIFLASY